MDHGTEAVEVTVALLWSWGSVLLYQHAAEQVNAVHDVGLQLLFDHALFQLLHNLAQFEDAGVLGAVDAHGVNHEVVGLLEVDLVGGLATEGQGFLVGHDSLFLAAVGHYHLWTAHSRVVDGLYLSL